MANDSKPGVAEWTRVADMDRLQASRPIADNARVTLVLGPTGRGELFDEMLARLSRTADPLNPAGNKPQVAANNGPMGTISSHEVFTLACQAVLSSARRNLVDDFDRLRESICLTPAISHRQAVVNQHDVM